MKKLWHKLPLTRCSSQAHGPTQSWAGPQKLWGKVSSSCFKFFLLSLMNETTGKNDNFKKILHLIPFTYTILEKSRDKTGRRKHLSEIGLLWIISVCSSTYLPAYNMTSFCMAKIHIYIHIYISHNIYIVIILYTICIKYDLRYMI